MRLGIGHILQAPAALDYYELRDTGTILISESSSLLAFSKPTRSAGDLLLTVCCSSNENDADLYDPTSKWELLWTNDVADYTVQLYGRIATNDSDDDANFAGPFAGVVRLGQMAAFGGTAVWSGAMNAIKVNDDEIDDSTESTFSYPGIAGGGFDYNLGIIASVKGDLTDTSDGSTVDAESGLTILGQALSDYDGFEDARFVWAYVMLPDNTDNISAGAWDITGGTESGRVDGISVRLKSDDS